MMQRQIPRQKTMYDSRLLNLENRVDQGLIVIKI